MKRNVNVMTIPICCILLTLLCLLIGSAGCNQVGRYQLVGRDSGRPYVIDTTTGKTWTRNPPRTHKLVEITLPGKIGRYKGAYTNSNLYIIDTTTGKAWTR